MAGRFPLYTDADVHGPYVDGLVLNGWNVLRAIDAYAEKTPDLPHFERAVREGRVLVSNDLDHLAIAHEWLKVGRAFKGIVTWAKLDERKMSVGFIVRAFEELAKQDDPFSPYPIIRIKPNA